MKERENLVSPEFDFLSNTVHFHTRVLDQETVDDLIRYQIASVEFNINSHNGQWYIGHDQLMYPSDDVSVDTAITAAYENDWFVKLDCKNIEAYDGVVQASQLIDRFMLHAFASELNFSGEPRPSDIDFDDITSLDKEIGSVPLQVSCRGIAYDNIHEHIDEIIELAETNSTAVVNFNLSDNEIVPDDILYKVHEHNMLAEVYVHKLNGYIPPVRVFRTANFVEDATRLDKVK